MAGFELIVVFIFLCVIKKIQNTLVQTPTPSPTPTPTPAVMLTLEAPNRFNPCETITLHGTLTKELTPLTNIPVTVYGSALGATQPIVTVKTNSKGEYTITGTIGSDIHFSTHVETPVNLWAEAQVNGVKHASPKHSLTAYADECMGPCPGTMLVTLKKLARFL